MIFIITIKQIKTRLQLQTELKSKEIIDLKSVLFIKEEKHQNERKLYINETNQLDKLKNNR